MHIADYPRVQDVDLLSLAEDKLGTRSGATVAAVGIQAAFN